MWIEIILSALDESWAELHMMKQTIADFMHVRVGTAYVKSK